MSISSFLPLNPCNSFPERSLKITFIFPKNLENPIVIEGLRTEISIINSGQEIGSTAEIKLHAVAFETLFKLLKCNSAPLSETPLMLGLSGAEIKIEAGNKGDFLSLIFYGKIHHCHAQFKAPHRLLSIMASSNLLYNDKALNTPAYTKPVWASQILKDLCQTQKIRLENQDFDALIQPPFSPNGTFLTQVSQIMNAQNGFFYLDSLQKKLSVSKSDFPVQSEKRILDEKDLISFPYYSDQLLSVRCVFQSNLHLGSPVEIQAAPIEGKNIYLNTPHQLNAAWNGQWIIHAFSHVLSSEKSHTSWETHLHAHRLP